MSTLDESPTKTNGQSPPPATAEEAGTGGEVAGILRRWKRDDLVRRGSLGLRGIALFLSLISFIVMASNKHGDWKEFDKYEEYR